MVDAKASPPLLEHPPHQQLIGEGSVRRRCPSRLAPSPSAVYAVLRGAHCCARSSGTPTHRLHPGPMAALLGCRFSYSWPEASVPVQPTLTRCFALASADHDTFRHEINHWFIRHDLNWLHARGRSTVFPNPGVRLGRWQGTTDQRCCAIRVPYINHPQVLHHSACGDSLRVVQTSPHRRNRPQQTALADLAAPGCGIYYQRAQLMPGCASTPIAASS